MTANEKLAAWLDRVNARVLAQKEIKETNSTVTFYSINGQSVIVNRWFGAGFEIYVPPTNSVRIDETLDAAAVRLGVDRCRDLWPESEGADACYA